MILNKNSFNYIVLDHVELHYLLIKVHLHLTLFENDFLWHHTTDTLKLGVWCFQLSLEMPDLFLWVVRNTDPL